MSQADNSIKMSKAWLIFGLVALFLVYEMALQVYPAVITEQLMHDLHLNAYGLGLMSGIYFYTYTCMQIPAGLLFDRFNPRIVIILPLLICVSGALIFSLSSSAWIASLARLLMGTGSAFAFISVLVVANDLFSAKQFAFLTGVAQMLAAFGAIAGGLPLVGLINTYGWRIPLIVISLLGFLLICFIWFYVRYSRKSHLENSNVTHKLRHSLYLICRNSQTYFIACYACLLWAPMSAFASLWGVPFLANYHHLSKAAAVNANSFMWLGIALGSPLLGWWSDHIQLRKIPLLLSALVGLFAFSFIIFVRNLPFPVIALGLFLVGAACSGQALSFAVVRENNISGTHAAAISFNNMAVVIAGAVFQPLIGKLIQYHTMSAVVTYTGEDYFRGVCILPACFALGAIITLLFIKETHCQTRH